MEITVKIEGVPAEITAAVRKEVENNLRNTRGVSIKKIRDRATVSHD